VILENTYPVRVINMFEISRHIGQINFQNQCSQRKVLKRSLWIVERASCLLIIGECEG